MASFPSLYRARAVDIDATGRKVTVFVPAVFGEQPITVIDFINGAPSNPGMGWVFFQAANPEFPVWVGSKAEGGGGGGGGTDEVWVGPSVPSNPDLELWYDTDASPIAPVGVAYVHNQGVTATVWTINHNLGFFPNATVIDSGGAQVEGDPVHLNNNTLKITFSASFTGIAYLS